jgi:hypothetical protein
VGERRRRLNNKKNLEKITVNKKNYILLFRFFIVLIDVLLSGLQSG